MFTRMSRRTPAPNRSCDSIQDNYLGLLRTYDSDNNGRIDIGEVGDAGEDYSGGEISLEELEVISFAFDVGCSFPAEPPDPPENESPNARFSISPQSGTAPFTATLDASASNDPDGSIRSYTWAFSDRRGSPKGKQITERFTEDDVGTINVGLNIVDDDGAKGFQRKSITVRKPQNEPPEARASYSVR